MIFSFLKKQKETKKKIELLKIMVQSLNIPEEQKELYIESFSILDKDGIEKLYKETTLFIESYEIHELEEINEKNFSSIAGMRKKEAIEKAKEMNAFSFLLHNV
jgi:hypothetical protein